MLQHVPLGSKSLSDYTHICGKDLIDEIRALAAPLAGSRILHLSTTAYGGGVAELLQSIVPLMRDVGLSVEWQVVYGREDYFTATKMMHNALQGADEDLSPDQWTTWENYNEMNARELGTGWDVAIVHDAQPAAMRALAPEKATAWVWRCHIDLSTPNPATIERMRPWLKGFDAGVFHLRSYAPESFTGQIHVVPPAIDPLAPKNMTLPSDEAELIVGQLGLDPARPLVTQVSRFDPWKDPLGVIDAFRAARERVDAGAAGAPQLALIGSMASDDPQGWEYFERTRAHAQGDPDIHILNNFNNVGAVEVNAFQAHSQVLVQKSTREGFGLTVAEGIWKGRPFIGGDVGGIPLQITDGETGYLVGSVEECADRIVQLLENPALGLELGRRGKEHIRAHYLTPRLLRDWLRIITGLVES